MSKCPEGYLEPSQTSKMEHFAEIVNGFLPLIVLAVNLQKAPS